ncbi:hypothetical protein LINGRAPRIM_LOCUS355 [Linum grandiflorum]
MSQLTWLEGVLKVGAGCKWKLSLVCEPKSKGRTISATKFHLQGRLVLKIYEKCSNRKIFFVIILGESAAGGWLPLWKLLHQEMGAVVGIPSSSMAKRSFEKVVKNDSFSSHGRCGRDCVKGLEGVRVEDDGVKERYRYIARCLVFRFAYHETINWSEFRDWESKHGVPPRPQLKVSTMI